MDCIFWVLLWLYFDQVGVKEWDQWGQWDAVALNDDLCHGGHTAPGSFPEAVVSLRPCVLERLDPRALLAEEDSLQMDPNGF